jgi:hypothetical protein
VFDVMAYYFRLPAIAAQARAKAEDVLFAYKRLSTTDPEFVDAVQSTTKSIPATHLRLERWGLALTHTAGIDVPVPVLAKGRMRVTT